MNVHIFQEPLAMQVYFWTMYSVSLIYMPTLAPISHCIIIVSWSFEVNFALLFKFFWLFKSILISGRSYFSSILWTYLFIIVILKCLINPASVSQWVSFYWLLILLTVKHNFVFLKCLLFFFYFAPDIVNDRFEALKFVIFPWKVLIIVLVHCSISNWTAWTCVGLDLDFVSRDL